MAPTKKLATPKVSNLTPKFSSLSESDDEGTTQDEGPPPKKRVKKQQQDKNGEATELSKTAGQFALITRSQARAMIDRLNRGYTDRSGSSYPAAITTPSGCILSQKKPNRGQNGFIQIAPISDINDDGTATGSAKVKALPQSASRISILAFGTDADRLALIEKGWTANHRCDQTTCIAADHIVAEPKGHLDKRKTCSKDLWVCEFEGGKMQSKYKCGYEPACIPRVIEGEALSE